MKYAASWCSLSAIVLCGWIVISQHQGSEGLWWRVEAGPMPKEDCRALLKHVTTRPKVGLTAKWYDVTPLQLEKVFGQAATPDKGTWVNCWPEGTDFSEPDS